MMMNILKNVRELFTLVKFIFSLNKLYKYIKKNNLISNNLYGKKIIINSVRTYIPQQITTELYFALLLTVNGAKVHILYDNNTLLMHDTNHYEVSKIKKILKMLRDKIFATPILFCGLFHDLKISYSDILRRGSNEPHQTDLNHHVYASLARYYLSSTNERCLEGEKSFKTVKKKIELNAGLSLNAAVTCNKILEPDFILTSHGIYSTWGPFYEFFKTKNIKTICYGVNCFEPGTIDISMNDIAATRFDSEFYDFFHNYKKENSIESLVDDYADKLIFSRLSFGASDQKIFEQNIHKSSVDSSIQQKLDNIDSNSHVVGIFPNVLWDNATTFRHLNTLFSSPAEWLIQTISSLLKGNNTVILRIHPAEGATARKVRKGVYEIIQKNLASLIDHKNLIIIESDDIYSSYKLFDYLDAATIYNGTIGYELLKQRIPTIVASNAPFSKCIATPKNKKEYYHMLNNYEFSDLMFDQDKYNSLIYYYFKLHRLNFPTWANELFELKDELKYSDLYTREMTHFIDVLTGKNKYFQEINLE